MSSSKLTFNPSIIRPGSMQTSNQHKFTNPLYIQSNQQRSMKNNASVGLNDGKSSEDHVPEKITWCEALQTSTPKNSQNKPQLCYWQDVLQTERTASSGVPIRKLMSFRQKQQNVFGVCQVRIIRSNVDN